MLWINSNHTSIGSCWQTILKHINLAIPVKWEKKIVTRNVSGILTNPFPKSMFIITVETIIDNRANRPSFLSNSLLFHGCPSMGGGFFLRISKGGFTTDKWQPPNNCYSRLIWASWILDRVDIWVFLWYGLVPC